MGKRSVDDRDDIVYPSSRDPDEPTRSNLENGLLTRPSLDEEGGSQRILERQSQFAGDQNFLSRMSSRSEGYQGPDNAVTVTRTLSLSRKDWEKLLTERKALQQQDSSWKLDQNSYMATNYDVQKSKRSIMMLPLINPLHPFSLFWHMGMLLVDLTYTAFVVPVGVGFDISDTAWTWCAVVDFIAGMVFFADLVLGFHTGYVVTFNFKRKVVMDGRLVAKFYVLRGTFVVDFLSTCAWITQVVLIGLTARGSNEERLASQLQIMRILRLTRLTRLVKGLFIQSGTGTPRLPGLQKLGSTLTYFLQILFSIAVLINFLGCLWYWVADREGLDGTWVTAYGPWVEEYGGGDARLDASTVRAYISKPRLYLASVYWGLTTVATIGYGDIAPQTAIEQGVAMVVFIVGIIFFGVLIGSLGQLLQSASKDARKAQLYREKMEHVEDWLRTRNFPMRLKRRIREYYAQVWVRQAEEADESELLEELPHTLRTEALWSISRKSLTELPIFAELPTPLQLLLASHLKPRHLPPGHDICHQGGPARSMWLLEFGHLVPVWNDLEGETHSETYLINGAALLQEVMPAFSKNVRGYRTVTACGLWEWSVSKVLNICKHHPGLYEYLAEHLKKELLDRMQREPESWPQAVYDLLQQMLVDSLPTDPMEVDPSNPSLGPPISCFAEGQQADGDAAIEAATLEEEEATAAENAPEADGVPINSNQVAVQPGMPAVADLSGAAKNQSTSGQAQAAGQRALRPSVTFQADHQGPGPGSDNVPSKPPVFSSGSHGKTGAGHVRVRMPADGSRRARSGRKRQEESDDEDEEVEGLIAGIEEEDVGWRDISVHQVAQALNDIRDQLAELHTVVHSGFNSKN